jgi:hypothetical protein
MSFSIVGALIMMVVCTVVTALLTKAPPNAAASALGDFTVPTAEEGRPFSILLGTGKCKGPNVTWYGDLHVGDVSVHGGLFKGPQVIGHFYSLGMQQMLCIGPIDSLEDILIGDKSLKARGVSFPQAYSALGTRITITHDQGYDLFGGSQSEGGVTGTLSFYFGSDTQDSDPYLERVLGAPLPAYRNVCYAVLECMYLGTSPYLKNWAFVLRHCPCPAGFDPSKKNIDGDCNAAYGLAYLLTLSRELGGLGESLTSLDLASFQGAANTLYAEKFGISLLIDTAKSADAWMAEILHHINAVLYTDPATGLTCLKLIRDDYDPDTLPEFTEADWMEAPEITVSALPETLNRVIVRYVDRAQDFTTRTAQGQDVANYWSQGQNASITLDFLALSNATNAQKVASREMFMLAAQMVKGSGKLNRRAWSLRPGSPFKLTFPPQGIQGLVCRVTNIRYGTLGSGGITIEFAQDVFSVSGFAHEAPPASTWQNPLAAPVACSAQALVEAPYGLVGESRQVLALGARGDATTTAAEIWTDEGSGYLLTGTLSPMSPTGLLGSAWSARTAALDMGGFTVGAGIDLDRLPGASTNADGRGRGVNLALFESGEIVSWTTATRNTDGTYAISGGILRGVLDTVPTDHAAGERVWFITEGSSDTRSLTTNGESGSSGRDGESGRSYIWHGEWDATHVYSVDDTCRRNGSSYVSIQDGAGQDPATATAYWDLMAQKGADATGGGESLPICTFATLPEGTDSLRVFCTDALIPCGQGAVGNGSLTSLYLPNYYALPPDATRLVLRDWRGANVLSTSQRWNYLLNSQALGSWGVTGNVSITNNAVAGPDGTQTCARITSTAANPYFHGSVASSAPRGVDIVGSGYLKAGTAASVFLQFYRLSGGSCTHSGAAILEGPGTITWDANGATITGLSATEFTRFQLVGQAPAGGDLILCNTIQGGVVGQSVYATKYQVEVGAQASPFIYTTSSAESTTDYSRDGYSGQVTLGAALPAGGILQWHTVGGILYFWNGTWRTLDGVRARQA